MKCNDCKHLRINGFKFEDGTQSIDCEKFIKFLGFTNKKGQVDYRKLKSVNQCTGDFVLRQTNFNGGKSGIPGVTWDKKSKKWRVMIWDKDKKRYKHIGWEIELAKAQKMLENAKREELLNEKA